MTYFSPFLTFFIVISTANALFRKYKQWLKESFFIHIVYELHFQNALILVVLNVFYLKCTICHLSFWNKCYNTWTVAKLKILEFKSNPLICKNVGVKLQKFLKGTDNWKKSMFCFSYSFELNCFLFQIEI